MKRTLLILASLAMLTPPAAAACRVKARVVEQVVESQVVAVPLAVAVGVPVAQTTPYYYSYATYSNGGSPAPVDLDALADKIAARLRSASSAPAGPAKWDGAPLRPPAAGTSQNPSPTVDRTASVIQQRCVVCHSSADPKAKLSLENPAALDPASRLKAIRAVLSEKMPKDGPRLTPEEAGKALEELAGE